ncbi:centromere/kinetochore protein zw10 homolog [Neodiprion lecontei]|uniref:Centromere/kinetochore protein zw10 homolog n=1 Tax=Neodiprion lecontei TaxID=441921 RepID=A0A6J0BQK3_NEOLC|nr:centromere/kinetochore protein zw10 homolog [Neodiprion lecontei]
MSSFLADVLVTAGKFEKIDLTTKISELQAQISKSKCDVKEYIKDNYIEFVPKLKKDQSLIHDIQRHFDEINILQKRVQDQIKIELSGSTRELKNLSNDLQKSSISLALSSRLIEITDCLQSAESYKRDKQYVEAAKTLQCMQKLLDDPNTDLQYLDIFRALKNNYSATYGTFLTDVTVLWQQYIQWEIVEDSSQHSCVNLSIKCDLEEMQNLVEALHHVDNLSGNLNKLANKLMKYLIGPIINYKCSVFVTDETKFSVQHLDETKKPEYKSVLHNLTLLFQFMHQNLNVRLKDGQRFLTKLEPHIFKQFSENLINDCISHTIPSSSLELQNFEPVIQDISKFQDYLVEIEFIAPDKVFLSEYIKNVDGLFIKKICQDFLGKARTVMKKDLHDTVKHEIQGPQKWLDNTSASNDFTINRKLSEDTFQLPPCQISKSVKEILDLVKEILDETCRSSDMCAVRLFYTSRNIVEMYAVLVPEHHKKFLETIPQQVALFHNNCMYLAHHLFVLTHEYKNKLPDVLRNRNVTYTDQTLVLRSTGSECFLEHMKYQRNIIIDILRESGLSTLGQVPELPPNTEKAIRQCIRQLELLKTVWLNVLPSNIYCRAVGCIMNSMIDELVTRVINVEDIPADVATELVTLFNMIMNRAPSIFPEPNTIRLHVKRWQKLSELVIVLGASLKEIDNRWADGKGLLAHEFTAAQVKQLIRALFQNTDRRSMLLASIK